MPIEQAIPESTVDPDLAENLGSQCEMTDFFSTIRW